MRICDEGVVEQLLEVARVVFGMSECPEVGGCPGGSARMWVGGASFNTCKCILPLLAGVFRSVSMGERNRVTFHVYNEASDIVASYNTGALMKHVPFVGYVDNIMFSQGLDMWAARDADPTVVLEMARSLPLFSTLSMLTPYQHHNPPARAALSSHYIMQALSLPVNTVGYTMRPLYSQRPIVVTEECKRLFPDLDMVPGLNVLVVYLSTDLTYEDAFLMSATCARRFMCLVESVVPVTERERSMYNVGDTVEPCSKSWWPVPVAGLVSGFHVTSNGEHRMKVTRETCAVTGDKFSTWHGQKGVVTVVPDRIMPLLPDGRVAELVVSSTTLIKRGTVGQLMESYVEPDAYGDTLVSEDTPVDRESMGSIEVTDRIPSCHDTERKVEAHYGTIRLMHSCHMSFDKHQFTRYKVSAFSGNARGGRSTGGDVHLGEMEVQQMVGNGLTNCLEELHIKGNMSVVDVCITCGCVSMLCDCNGNSGGLIPTRLPSSFVEMATRVLVSSGLSTCIR